MSFSRPGSSWPPAIDDAVLLPVSARGSNLELPQWPRLDPANVAIQNLTPAIEPDGPHELRPAPEPPIAVLPAQPAAEPVRGQTFARVIEELVAWFKTLLSAAVYATLIVTFGFQVARVEGQSMAPTLQDQDRLIVNKLAYRMHKPQVGDIVMLLYPNDPDKSFVKRIVAEPGDTIRGVDGRVYRNDVPLPDDFIPEEYRDHTTWGPEVLREGYYWVMGDHRNNSSDSRSWGAVPQSASLGKVQIRWWPLGQSKNISIIDQ